MVLFGALRDPEYFCFCYNLKHGTILIGFCYLIIFFFLCSQLLWHPCYTNILTMNCPVHRECWILICIINIFHMLGVITSIGLLYGVFCEIRRHVTRFLYIVSIAAVFVPLVFNTVIMILSRFLGKKNPSCYFAPNLGACMIMTVLFITITGYIITVVKSFRSGMEYNIPLDTCYEKPKADK